MLKRLVVAGLWKLSLGLDDMARRLFGTAIPEVSFLPTLLAVELEQRWCPQAKGGAVQPSPVDTAPVTFGQTWWAADPVWRPDEDGVCGSPTVLLSPDGVLAVRCNRAPHADDQHVHSDGPEIVEWEDLPDGAVRFKARGVL